MDGRDTATHIAIVAGVQENGEVDTYSLWASPNGNPYPEKISVHDSLKAVLDGRKPTLCFSTAKWNSA